MRLPRGCAPKPWLDRTGGYLATVAFGDTAAVEHAVATVRRMRHGFCGIEPETDWLYVVVLPTPLGPSMEMNSPDVCTACPF
ncbi:hypothetical protein [Parasphingorhabdus pacifica]